MSALPLRPRSAPEIVDASIQLARRHYAPLLVLSTIIAIPGLLIGLVNAWLIPAPETALRASPLAALLVVPLTVIGMGWTFVGFGALVASASAAYTTGAPLATDVAVRQGLSHGWALFGGLLLAYLRASIGALLAMIPLMLVGVVLTAIAGRNPVIAGLVVVAALVLSVGWFLTIAGRYATVPSVIMIEGSGATASLRRSRALTEGSLRRIVGLLALVAGMVTVLSGTMFFLADALADSEALASAVVSVATIPVYPVFACVFALLYYDLRIRKEGYDIELMARELGDLPPAPAATEQPSF